MSVKGLIRSGSKLMFAAAGVATAGYATYVGVTWFRYGKSFACRGRTDELLDRFMSSYDVGDHHQIRVAAPPDVVLSAAMNTDFEDSPWVRGIFKAREWLLFSKPEKTERPRGLIAQTKSMGWAELANVPGRELVMGAATKPWEANPVFRGLSADEFASFREPDYVKIVWTLRADPVNAHETIFRTETRAVATDEPARKKFRWYWAFLSPGIKAIRIAMGAAVKKNAEEVARRGSVLKTAKNNH